MSNIKPTLFLTNDEVAEAIKLGYLPEHRISKNYSYGIHYQAPTLFWMSEDNLTHQPNVENLLLGKYFYVLSTAVKWSDISEEFKPKWYEEEGVFPCLCWVWGPGKNEKERASMVTKYSGEFYSTRDGIWSNATPVTAEYLCKS